MKRAPSLRAWIQCKLLLPSLLSLAFVACANERSKPTAAERSRITTDSIRNEFTSAVGGVDISEDKLLAFSMERTFSLDVDRLLTSSGKSIVFEADLADIRRVGGDTLAIFAPQVMSMGVDLYWSLKVPTPLLDSLYSMPRERFSEGVLVAAKVFSVNRPLLMLKAEAAEEGVANVKPDVADYFVVSGELVGVRRLPSR